MTASVKRVAVVEVAMVEVAVIKVVAINNRSTMRDVGVVVVDHSVAVPVPSPVIPAPPKSPEESNSESRAEVKSRTAIKDSGHRIPTWVGDDGIAVDEPGIIRRDIDHIRIGRLDDNRFAFGRYLLLVAAIQMAGLLSLLAHHLDGTHHVLLLVGICVSK